MISRAWLVLSASLVLSVPAVSWAGAWTQPQGKLYARVSLNGYVSDQEFDADGERHPLPDDGDYRDLNVGNYLEYGVSDRYTVLAAVYLKYLKKDDSVRETETYGVGDIDLGVRMKFAEGRWGFFSGQGLVKVPEAYDEDDELPLGNGQYDVELRLLYGHSLWPLIPGYCNLEAGYRWRAEEPSDEIRYLLEVGSDVTRHLYARVKLDGTYSRENGADRDAGGNPTATYNPHLGKLDAVIGCRIGASWMVELGYAPELYGENTSAGATYTLALAYRTP